MRGLGCHHDRATTAVKAVANQSLPLEVSASGTTTLVVDESRLPLSVFRVWLVATRLIRLW
jgi:hypothetical protein